MFIKNDSKAVSVAVQNNGLALQFAVEKLKANETIALLAFKQNMHAYKFIDDKL